MRKPPEIGQPSPHRVLDQTGPKPRAQLNVSLEAEWVEYVRQMAKSRRKKPFEIVQDALAEYRTKAGEP